MRNTIHNLRSQQPEVQHQQCERSRRKQSPRAAATRHCDCILSGLTFTAPDIRAVPCTKKNETINRGAIDDDLDNRNNTTTDIAI